MTYSIIEIINFIFNHDKIYKKEIVLIEENKNEADIKKTDI